MPTAPFTPADYEAAKSWPFQEARALMKRLEKVEKDGTKETVVFETGYGPSGLPHIGTFGEVARTTMVRRAFEALTGRASKIICFSDDMDGLRKVPPNLPNQSLLEQNLQKPLSRVPDPFGTHESFSAHNNAKLREFLDRFGFEYEFMSATEAYSSGAFDQTMIRMLEVYDEVMDIILPTLGEERQKTYSPILPISPKTGRVLYVPLLDRDATTGEVVFEDEDGTRTTMDVRGGRAKLQWKADWAGRWYALGVDYEMSGEDLTESVRLSNRIVAALGGTPPAGFQYQLFLDEEGRKISKSKGNGLTIEQWLRYAEPESLSLFNFASPKKAKKLYFDVIPKTADDYRAHVEHYQGQEGAKALDNPAWHIHGEDVPTAIPAVPFGLLLNIVDAGGIDDANVLRGFVAKYRPDADEAERAAVEPLIEHAIAYFHDFVLPKKHYREPTEQEGKALAILAETLSGMTGEEDEQALQTVVFDAGKAAEFENLRAWFVGLYEVVFGQSEGPRMGPFIKIYGPKETAALIEGALARSHTRAAAQE
ncbi:lysine--tRNA ligase [Parvularcula dongshanensis]|uniref:Lysine--tRNA ligase n=1 Tax=Parvularcula dongshanensis TaxID=1173995 RepID=A0A840I029_9PROT|nr:lysine--tRNA ligase [Parvularcula dongshanensis]MBB4658179.1 lysyl-tRNA synthetase class 1 [Parvularcula dongshanensis]